MIIKPFNGVFLMLLLLMVALIVGIWRLLRQKSESFKKWALIALCAVNIVIYFLYKFALSTDTAYVELTQIGRFNWFNELPLHLCNINMFLIPIGLMTRRRAILGFSFFVAPLGAMLALLFPSMGFAGFPLFLPRVLGFYLTHLLIVTAALSLGTLGFYQPSRRDFPRIILILLALLVMMFGVNTLLRATVCPFANYFYTYHEDINILNLLWKWIPVPVLYELPAILLLYGYMEAVTAVTGAARGKAHAARAAAH